MGNPGEEPARLLEVYAPGGLEGYFEELAALFVALNVTPETLKAVQTARGIAPAGGPAA